MKNNPQVPTFRKLERDALRLENNLYAQRLHPWPGGLDAPFEGSWCVIEKGSQSTAHAHHEYEIFIAVSGQAFIECRGERTMFEAGDIVHFRPGVPHRVVNEGEEAFEMYSVWWDAAMSSSFLARHFGQASGCASSRTLIIAPPPTPNGDLHVGHMAGPYLAGDIYARFLRTQGKSVNYATGTDDSQTYVVTSAHKLGMSPEKLCSQSSQDISDSLAAWDISLDGYAPYDEGYRAMVIDFLTPLYEAGKLPLRRVLLPFSELRGEYMVESLVCGECPVCLSLSRGGLCEACGHPNNFDQLRNPVSSLPPFEPLCYREADILVFQVEEYRRELTAFYQSRKGLWRPHILQLMDELFSRELIDFPVTYPVTWGIPCPFPDAQGQVFNAWVEGMPASMYCSACGEQTSEDTDATWRSETANRLVYFLGFDNSYFWGVTHLALLMAHDGKYILPEFIVPNAFYELENEKFSTSRGHLIWARDLLQQLPRDYARFYLCLTSPEHNRSNFSLSGLQQIVSERLTGPWNSMVTAYNERTWDTRISLTPDRAAAVMKERLAVACCIETFSQSALADWILQNISRLEAVVHKESGITLAGINDQLAVLIAGMGIVLTDFYQQHVACLHATPCEKLALSLLPAVSATETMPA